MSRLNPTLKELAQDALQVQDACNLSGVVFSFGRAMEALWKILKEEKGADTDAVNRHPIAVMYSSKIASLTGSDDAAQFSAAYTACQALANPK